MPLREELARQGYWLFRWRSYLPLLVFPLIAVALLEGEYFETRFGDAADFLWESVSIGVAFFGLVVRAFTAGFVPSGTSGRNTRAQKADVLNQTGMYSVVRHPLYLANYIVFLGILMFTQAPWLMLAATFAYWMYYERIAYAEEDFLDKRFGNTYERWATVTPAVLPNVRLWKGPELPFSWRSVLAREHPTWFATIAILVAIEIFSSIIEGEPEILDRNWTVFFAIGIMLYLLLRFLRKHTRLLKEEGR